MLDRTKAIVNKTVQDVKRFAYVLNVCTQLFYIAFLVYSTLTKTGGVHIANGILCILSTAYFIFFMCVTKWGKDIEAQKQTKLGKMLYKWCKRICKIYTLGVMVYGIFATTTAATPIAVLFCAAMVALFLFTCIFELLGFIIGKRVELFMLALEADVEPVTKPVRSVGNFFKKLTGQEVEPEKERDERDEKNLVVLDNLVADEKEKQRQKAEAWRKKKAEEKEALLRQKKEEKERTKAQKAAEKLSKKQKKANEEIAATGDE